MCPGWAQKISAILALWRTGFGFFPFQPLTSLNPAHDHRTCLNAYGESVIMQQPLCGVLMMNTNITITRVYAFNIT